MPLKPHPTSSDMGSDAARRKVVAFDFDGTLTTRDSFTAFLIYAKGRMAVGSRFVTQPRLLMDYIRTRDRGALKSRLLYNLVGGISQAELETLIKAFVAATGTSLFRPDALMAWEAQNLPDRQRVIVTASPEMLVAPFGALIGADRVIGTRLGFSADNRLLPDLDGPNCRGAEKMVRLRDVFGDTLDLEAAYGDTSGDSEMIAAATHGHYRVFTGKP